MVMNDFSYRSFAATAYHTPSTVRPTFALPLISQLPGGNAFYSQDITEDGLVEDFSPLDHDLPNATLSQNHPISVGDQVLFVVLGPNGEEAIGTRSNLTDIVASWAREVPYLLTRLSFLEFAGANDEAQVVARSLFRERVELLGEAQAKSWFSEAIIVPRLLRLAGKVTWRDRINLTVWADRSRLNVNLPSKLHQTIDRLDGSAEPGQLEHVRLLVRDVIGLGLSIGSSQSPPAGKVSEEELVTRRLVECARYVSSLARQEERIAQLLSYVCEAPSAAAMLVSLIKPRAALETKALGLIRDITPSLKKDRVSELLVEQLVHELYRSGYPMRRGELIFEIASRVRSQGSDKAVRRLLANTSSHDLARYETAILAVLGE